MIYKILPGSKKPLRRQNTQGFYGKYSGGGKWVKKVEGKGTVLSTSLRKN
jgi:hypothetical protein